MVLRASGFFFLATMASYVRFEGHLQTGLRLAIHDAEDAGQCHLLVVADIMGEPLVAVAKG